MPAATLRALLNRLRWDAAERAAGVTLEYRVRQERREGVEEAPFTDVVAILPQGVILVSGTFLPYHRVVMVRRDSETLWVARGGKGGAYED